MRIFLDAAIVAASAALLSACATPDGARPDPQVVALERSQRTIQTGLEDASAESEAIEEFVVRLRHNPCQCAAPPDEIYIHERWTRVYLQGDEALLAAIKKSQARAAERIQLETLSVRGGLADKTRPSARGIVYLIFEVLALE